MASSPPSSACREGRVVTDGASSINPLVAEGPRLPVETLRPAPSLQRVLLLDRAQPRMADLASGDIRAWENGPPVSVPMVSAAFALDAYKRLQVQVLRDPRPTSVESVLFSLRCGSTTLDIVETTTSELLIRGSKGTVASGPIGGSPAVVIVLRPDRERRVIDVVARNAETLTGMDATVAVTSWEPATLTIGGPSIDATARHGRRRLIPVHIEAEPVLDPADQVRRAVSGARRVAGAVRDRVL